MKELELVILNATGLHARPAKAFVKLAKKFDSKVQIQYGEKKVNGKSLIGVLKLGVKYSGEIRVLVDGADEDAAADALKEAVETGLGEGVPGAAHANGHSNGHHASSKPKAKAKVAPAAEAPTEGGLQGIPASKGVAVGPLWQFRDAEVTLTQEFVGISAETKLLNDGIAAAQTQLAQLRDVTAEKLGEEEAGIFEAHSEILNDPEMMQRAVSLINDGQNAQRAWKTAFEESAQVLSQLDDELLAARAADIRDVGMRLLRIMTGQSASAMPTTPFVLTADDLSPSVTATLDKDLVKAICTAHGGPNAHAAILARALGIPAVVGIGDALLDLADGLQVIVDAESGKINTSPSDEEIKAAETRREELASHYASALAKSGERALTTDGHYVEVVANVGNAADAEQAFQNGAEGVGLLRTEFLFLERQDAPTIDEQVEAYSGVLKALKGQPVIIRTLDVGGDKPLPYIDVPHEENPFLGERGIRLCLNRPELFKAQLEALARSAEFGKVRVMFPMVSDLSELIRARQLFAEVCAQIGCEVPEIGIMIEVPSAALMADIFAPHVDFFSIGTNDLTQYTLAIDRMHPILTKQADGLHPAVLRLISKTVESAHAAGKWVGVCGALGADTQAVPILIGLGVDELSVNVPAIPLVKAQIRTLSLDDAKAMAQKALASASAAEVRALSA